MPDKQSIIEATNQTIKDATVSLEAASRNTHQLSYQLLKLIKNFKEREKSIEATYNASIAEDISNNKLRKEYKEVMDNSQIGTDAYNTAKDGLSQLAPSSNNDKIYLNITTVSALIKKTDKLLDTFYKSFSEDKSAVDTLDYEIRERLVKLTQYINSYQIKPEENTVMGAIKLNNSATLIQSKINSINNLVGNFNFYMNLFNNMIIGLRQGVINYRNTSTKKAIFLNIDEHFSNLQDLTNIRTIDNGYEELIMEYILSNTLTPLDIQSPIINDTQIDTKPFEEPSAKNQFVYTWNVGPMPDTDGATAGPNTDGTRPNTGGDDLDKVNANAKIQLTPDMWNSPTYIYPIFLRYLELIADFKGDISINVSDTLKPNFTVNIIVSDPNSPANFAIIVNKDNILHIFKYQNSNMLMSKIIEPFAYYNINTELYEYNITPTFEELTVALYVFLVQFDKNLVHYTGNNVYSTVRSSLVSRIVYNDFLTYEEFRQNANISIVKGSISDVINHLRASEPGQPANKKRKN